MASKTEKKVETAQLVKKLQEENKRLKKENVALRKQQRLESDCAIIDGMKYKIQSKYTDHRYMLDDLKKRMIDPNHLCVSLEKDE